MDVSLEIAANFGERIKFIRSGALDILMTPEECKWGKNLVNTLRRQGYTDEDVAYLSGD